MPVKIGHYSSRGSRDHDSRSRNRIAVLINHCTAYSKALTLNSPLRGRLFFRLRRQNDHLAIDTVCRPWHNLRENLPDGLVVNIYRDLSSHIDVSIFVEESIVGLSLDGIQHLLDGDIIHLQRQSALLGSHADLTEKQE